MPPVETIEERLSEALPKKQFRDGVRDRQGGAPAIPEKASPFLRREDNPPRHASLAGEEADAETLCGRDRYPTLLDHGMRRIHIFQRECERLVVAGGIGGVAPFGF